MKKLLSFILLLSLAHPVRASIGKATWYGNEFKGHKTASGQRFNPSAMTCASREYPIGTKLEVTNIRNGRAVIVTVNDKGGFKRPIIIDLSKAAARQLGIFGTATVHVKKV